MRTDPPENASETRPADGVLAYQRETPLMKAEGLNREQLARTHPPSSLTLAVLLHPVEETARHDGRADLLREAIDGVTGE
ncbi:DUF664 domain-containing protein [Blastococcus sp. TF02A-26]|uniref:mycothiol transferase n=1 Tax=Blastococcus sp. TF02A-26 TaxID=2250577 RepID=UPI001F17B7C8|nr:DUF664 domain-containing protein [Blastococcus sp. TF02A-26]